MSKIMARLEELNAPRGGSFDLDYLNLKPGRNVIRILPPKGDNFFAEETFVHYGVGKGENNEKGTTVVCPTTHDENAPCPVCELAKELKRLSKAKDDTYDKQYGELRRKKRIYYNAISREDDLTQFEKNGEGKWINKATGEEERPVKVLSTGIDVYKKLMGIIVDPEYGDITDEEEGLDVIITKSGTGRNTEYDVKTVRKESPIGFDVWEECLNDLKILSKCKTYEEIENIVNGKNHKEVVEEEVEEVEESVSSVSKTDSTTEGTATGDEEDDETQRLIEEALKRRKN